MKIVNLGVASVATKNPEIVRSVKDPASVGTIYGPKPL